jgi:hypothetical protein
MLLAAGKPGGMDFLTAASGKPLQVFNVKLFSFDFKG